MKTPKYTFKDWRDGKIPVPPYPEDANSTEFDKLHWRATTGGENRLYHWTESKPPLLSKEVYKIILDEKKNAWFTAVKQNVEQRLLKFNSENESFSKDELTEIIELELEKSQISNPDTLQKVKQQKYYSELITPEVYNKIQDGQYLRVNEFNKPYPKEVIEWMNEQQHQVRVQLGIQNPTWQDKINLFVAAEQNMYLKGIQHLLNTLNKEDVVKSKQYTPEEQKIYFEYAEWQADRLVERFNAKLEHGTDAISKEDLLQMEIKEADARVQKYHPYIEDARCGWIEEHIIDYLKREEHPPPSIKKYSQFDAVKDYNYLKKLQWILKTLHTGGTNVDMDKLHSLVNKANKILQNDIDGIYKPYRGNPVIPNNLKGELAKHFKMGATTVYEHFEKYAQRDDQGTYKIKPIYLFFS